MYEYYLNCTRFEEQNEKDKEYHNVGRVTKFNRKMVKKSIPSDTQIHDRSLSWLDICTSIKSGGVKLVL
jgi:hypothetical protein